MDTTQSNTSSWIEAPSGTIDLPGCDPASIDRSVWFRHQTALESGSLTHIITSVQLLPPHPSLHTLNLDVVKTAVRQLRFDHPVIASKLGQSTEPPEPVFAYQVPGNESDIDTWLSTVVLDRTDILLASDGDVTKAVDAVTYELGKPASAGTHLFLVHYIPAASPDGQHGLVFIFSHTLFDAIGCFQIMDLCVSRIADSLAAGGKGRPLAWGNEVLRLPPALVKSARIPCTAEKRLEDNIPIQKVKDTFQSLPNVHKLHIPHPESSPKGTGLLTRTVSPDVLTNIRTIARTHGCTVFSILWAALVLSSVRIQPPGNTINATLPFIFSPVDIRPLACDDRFDRSQWVVRLSIGFNSYIARDLGRFIHSSSDTEDESTQLAEDVWVLAKEVRKQAEEQAKYTERMPVWIDDMMTTLTEALVGLMGDPVAAPGWYPILSSIGVVDKYLARTHPIATGGQITVSSARLSPCFFSPFGEGCLALHAFTWEGELILPFTFPEGVMGTAQDQAIALKKGYSGDAIALRFVNEFMHILDVISQLR